MNNFVKVIFLVASFSVIGEIAMAKIFKVKDKEGRVIYTDIPFSEYEEVEVKVKKVSPAELEQAKAKANNLDESSKANSKNLLKRMAEQEAKKNEKPGMPPKKEMMHEKAKKAEHYEKKHDD